MSISRKAASTPAAGTIETTLWNTSRAILSTKSNVASTKSTVDSTLLPFLATMSNKISSFRQSRNKLKQIEHVQFVLALWKGQNFTKKTCSTLLTFGSKVERCFDIVAGVVQKIFYRIFPKKIYRNKWYCSIKLSDHFL